MKVEEEKGFPEWGSFMAQRLVRRRLPWTLADLAHLVNRTADLEMVSIWCLSYLPLLVKIVEKEVAAHGLTKELRTGLVRLSKTLEWEENAPERTLSTLLPPLPAAPQQP